MALKATQPTLEEIADLCLAHLVENPEQLADFMTITGWSPTALQRAAKDGSLAPGLLDYVVQNEQLLKTQDELEEARWFSRQEITELTASGELMLPPSVSISRLIFSMPCMIVV